MRIVTHIGVGAIASLLALGVLTGCDDDPPETETAPATQIGGSADGAETNTEPPSEPGATAVVLNYDRCTYLGDRLQTGRFVVPVENASPFDGSITLARPNEGATIADLRAWAARLRAFVAAGREGPDPGPPSWQVIISAQVPSDAVSELPADVESGTYAIVCFQHDPAFQAEGPDPDRAPTPRAVYVAGVLTVER